MSEGAPGERAARPPLWREPALWGFLIGAALITATVPLVRRVPDPPPVSGRLPADWTWSLEDASGQPFGPSELAGRVAIVALLSRDEAAAAALGRALATLDDRYVRAEADILLVIVDLGGRSAARRADFVATSGGKRPARWHVLGGSPEATCGLARDVFGRAGESFTCADADALAMPPRLVIVDPTGGLRGTHGSSGDALDEAFERSLRVLDESS